jgi:ribose transport system ATP-binding protein
VADNVTLTRFSSCARLGVVQQHQQNAQTEKQTRALQVKMRSPQQRVRTLSGGNQQKVAFARLLHQEAEILLLDEPTRGIDVASKSQIYDAIGAAATQGKAVLMISSYLPELLGVCDRIAVMSRGRLGAARPAREWTPESVMEAAIGS